MPEWPKRLKDLSRSELASLGDQLLAGNPQCQNLCFRLEALSEEFQSAQSDADRRRNLAEYLAIERFREEMGCEPCFPI